MKKFRRKDAVEVGTDSQGNKTKIKMKIGGKVVKAIPEKGKCRKQKYSSPRWSYQILESKMPMSFDQYSHCSYNCKYCLAYYQKALKCINPLYPGEQKNYRQTKPRSINLTGFRKMMHGEGNSQFKDYIANRYPLEWGGLADPFCNFEKKMGTGLECLKIMDEVNYPASFSTKGTWFVYDNRYMRLFKRNSNWRMQWSIINLDAEIAKIVEGGVASPQKRLQAMEDFIGETGRSATLRLRPFIIGITNKDDEYLHLIEEAHARGCKRVSVEFFCLERRLSPGVQERYADMSEIAGFDLVDFYKRNSPGMSGYLRLNWKIKWEYVRKMLLLCKKLGMTFYSSDSMLKDTSRQFGNPPDMETSFDGNFSKAMLIAMKRESKLVQWCDIEPYVKKAGLYKFLWRHAAGYNTKGNRERAKRWKQTMGEYIHEMWNLPNEHNSPYNHFFGLLKPVKVDGHGDVVYMYNPRKIDYVN